MPFIHVIVPFGFILADLPMQPLALGPEVFNRGHPLYIPLFLKYGRRSSELGYQGDTIEFWPPLPVVILQRV